MHNILTVALKDWQLAGRTRDTLLSTAFFAGLLLLVLGIGLGSGLGTEAAQLRPAAAGAVWSALALAAAVAAGRAFASEQEAGALEALTLYPGPHGGLYLGKLLGTFAQMLLLAALVVPLGLLLFGALGAGVAVPWLPLILTVLLGLLGLSASSTFYAAVTVNLRAREALLPALAFPVLIPVVLASVQATRLLLLGGWSAEVGTWLGFLALFDASVIVISTLLFPFVLEN
ncbi:heme exporter protein CcmB [Deinococcus sp.]|uniref:heme exporter protein CcmB n=1 Tax=Deinococcus sp. TaxID=47478 RepID=UPI003CC6975D